MNSAYNPDLEWLISKASEGKAKYTDLRMQDMCRKILIAENGQEIYDNTQHLQGVGIRILSDSYWGFSFTSHLDEAHLVRCLENARKNPYSKGTEVSRETKPVQTKCKSEFRIHPNDISEDEKTAFLRLLSTRPKKTCSRIRKTQVLYKEVFGTTKIATSSGTFIELETISLGLVIWIAFRALGKTMTFSYDIAQYKGYETLEKIDLDKLINEIVEKVANLINAEGFCPSKFKVLLDPSIAGILIHETVGHLCEADAVLTGSVFSKRQGRLVASQELSVSDIGVVNGGIWCPYDDEGVKKAETSIIQNGVLKQFIHSKETAVRFNVQPTGNARSESFMYPPLVRQTNICTKPGDMKVKELLEGINTGLFIQSGISGSWDRNGDFSVLAQSAQWIRKGDLENYAASVKLKGNATKLLRKISGLSKEHDAEIAFFEGCNKENQMLPHGTKTPYMLILDAYVEPAYSLPWIDLAEEYRRMEKRNRDNEI